jgi:hypothetical protein
MAPARPLPLHQSSRRLRELCPEHPRVYGVAVMADVGRRRWWPLSSALATDNAVVRLPSQGALVTWTAHRCHRGVQPLFVQVHAVSGGALSVAAMWAAVGSAVVTAGTQVPQLAGSCRETGMRRGQALLDAFAGFGLPVRGALRMN